MKRMLLAASAMLCLSSIAQADVFNLGSGLTNLETVTVGDAGNVGDYRYGYDAKPCFGSVSYDYKIGKYEVTAAQYCDFLNAKAQTQDPYGLYNFLMGDYGPHIKRIFDGTQFTYSVDQMWANLPVSYISYWDSCRFANWLGNGQGDADTETGAYTLNGYCGDNCGSIQRNDGWKWALPSEDEWYKAAYYKGGGTEAGYWDYPVQSNTIDHTKANYNTDFASSVGSYPYTGAYGTFDQGGNVWEFNEDVLYQQESRASRVVRGGSFAWYMANGRYDNGLWAATGVYYDIYPTHESDTIGFRLVQSYQPVPEPSSVLALIAGIFSVSNLVWRRNRK